jgi:hypothetical protein
MMDFRMRLFISWSRKLSRDVALILREWLPYVIQSIEPWMSQSDLRAGKRWNEDVNENLRSAKFGIICVTQQNLKEPWLMFEAGALARSINDPLVCPYLIDLEPRELLQSPLAQFQAVKANAEGTWNLVRSINTAVNSPPLAEHKLARAFDKWWPDLVTKLGELGIGTAVEDVARDALALAQGRSSTATTPDEPTILQYMSTLSPAHLRQILEASSDTPPELLEAWYEQLKAHWPLPHNQPGDVANTTRNARK